MSRGVSVVLFPVRRQGSYIPVQFYLTADTEGLAPSAWRGNWNETTSAVTRRLDSTKATADLTKFTIQSVTIPESSTDPLYRVALGRFVSGPLAAQTISGTMQIRVGVQASNVSAELYFACHVYAMATDGSVRATLIDNFAELASSLNAFPFDAKGRDLILPAAITAGTIQDNDRVVVELGYIARNNTATVYSGTLFYGTDYYSNGSPDMIRD